MNAVNQIIQFTLKALQTSIVFNQRSQNIQQQSHQIFQNIVQTTQNFRWNAANLEFFDSLYDEKFAATRNAIEHSEKNIYFRDVYIFIERIKNIAQIKENLIVRNNLYICFRETILAWYTFNFENDQKRLVKLSDEIEKWIRVLLKKFRQFSSTIMTTVTRKRYTMNDAKRKKESIEYA